MSDSHNARADRTGKGRPTPKRKEAQARNARPLVPADRKEAKRLARQKRDEAFARERMALETGDERYLPIRDKGRIRRFVRDWVDARWSLSEFLLPLMVLFLVAMMASSFVRSLQTDFGALIMVGFTIGLYSLFAVSIIEGVIVWQRLKKRIALRFPNDSIPKGTWYYTYSRMIMARRWRSPRPLVARGEFPEVAAK